jgi:hypothetical protein
VVSPAGINALAHHFKKKMVLQSVSNGQHLNAFVAKPEDLSINDSYG